MSLRDMYVGITFKDKASRQLDKIDKKMDDIHRDFNRMDDDVDDLDRGFHRLGRGFGTTGIKAGIMGVAITSAFSGGVAASAPLLASVLALSASFAGAGIGAAVFGAVAVGSLGKIFEASEEVAAIEAKIANAETWEDKVAAQKELKELYSGMSEAQKGALEELEGFKGFWSEFIKQFETPIFTAFSKSLKLAEGVISRFAPTITKVGDVVNDMLTSMNDAVNSGGMNDFFNWLETTGVESFRNFSIILGNVTSGFFSMMEAFSPLTTYMEEGLISMTEKFKAWADGLSNSQGFQNFVNYVKENGPTLLETIGNIAGIFKNLIEDLAPFGTTILEGIKSFTGYINENWTTVTNLVVGLGAAVGSFLIMMKGMQIIGMINTLFTAWRTGTLMQTLAMWGLNTAMLANPITWVIAGIAALIAIGVLLWKNWDTVKEKAGQLWDKTKEVFGNIYKWGMKKIQPVVDFFKSLKDKFDAFKNAISNFKMPKWVSSIGNVFSGAASKVKGLFDGSHATGLASVPYDGYAAELHKDESVLTAKQSNTLREAGILKNDGSKPVVDFTPASAPARQVSGVGTTNNNTIHITVNESKDARSTADSIRIALEDYFGSLNRISPQVTEG
jgi:hypothetical protein